MSRRGWYIGCGALVVAAAACWSAMAQSFTGAAARPGTSSPPGELVTHFQTADSGATTLTLVDPAARVMAVYHIAKDTGSIQLKSVRNFSWDMTVEEFNSKNLSPADIRKMRELQQ